MQMPLQLLHSKKSSYTGDDRLEGMIDSGPITKFAN